MTNEREARLSGKEGELQVELLARNILIRIDMQASMQFTQTLEDLERFALMKSSGTGIMSSLTAWTMQSEGRAN